MITRAQWQAENRRTGAWGFDPDMPWSIANWHERAGIVFFRAFVWGVIFPAMLIGGLIVFGMMMDGVTRHHEEHERCLKHATNGYEIQRCR